MPEKKKEKNFILGHFYVILNLGLGGKPPLLPVSNGFSAGEDMGRLIHTPMLILRYPKSMWEEMSTLTKDLQLKWLSLCSEGMVQGEGELGALN
jgi:hypothetical protein